MHTVWFLDAGGYNVRLQRYALPFALLAAATYVALAATTALAARLTHWEASYRGLRLPLDVAWYTRYLYILSAEVILGALYLFKTYWIGMRNMMFANR